MNILFCTHDIDSGGSARSLSILAERLGKEHDVAILSLAEPDAAKSIYLQYEKQKIPVVVFPWNWLAAGYASAPGLPGRADLSDSLRGMLPKIKEFALRQDIICFNSYPAASLCSILPKAIPKFLIARDVILPGTCNFPAIATYLRRQIGAAVAIGPVEAAQLDAMGIANEVVFNTPVQLSPFSELPPLPMRIGVFSQFTRAKGVDILVGAANLASRALRAANAVIEVFGGGNPATHSFECALKQYVKDAGIDDIVRFNGWRNDAQAAMRGVHCVARPDATGSPWGRDVIEAMSLGRPVLAAGSEEVFVKPGKTGWLVKAGSVDDFAMGLIEVVNSQSAMSEYAVNAWNFARTNFDPERNARRIEAEMLKLVAHMRRK